MLCGRDPCLRVMMCNMEWYVYVREESGTDIYIYMHVHRLASSPAPPSFPLLAVQKSRRGPGIIYHTSGESLGMRLYSDLSRDL